MDKWKFATVAGVCWGEWVRGGTWASPWLSLVSSVSSFVNRRGLGVVSSEIGSESQ